MPTDPTRRRVRSRTIRSAALLTAAVCAAVGPSAAGPQPAAAREEARIPVSNAYTQTVDTVDLAAERPGLLVFVEPREGDTVREGQTVAKLRDDIPRAQLASARRQAEETITVEYAKKAADVARSEYEGILRANERKEGVIPFSEQERSRLSVEQSLAQIARSEFEREVAGLRAAEVEAELEGYKIDAPHDGVVTRVLRRTGSVVQQGEPILQVVDTRRMRVEGRLSLANSFRVSAGDPVEFRVVVEDADLPIEQETFTGRVQFVDPTESTRMRNEVRVLAEVPNEDGRLRAGLKVDMVVLPGENPDARTAAVEE